MCDPSSNITNDETPRSSKHDINEEQNSLKEDEWKIRNSPYL